MRAAGVNSQTAGRRGPQVLLSSTRVLGRPPTGGLDLAGPSGRRGAPHPTVREKAWPGLEVAHAQVKPAHALVGPADRAPGRALGPVSGP